MPIRVVCKKSETAAARAGETITNALINSVAQATAIGKRYLDDPDKGGYYITETSSLKLPHKSNDIGLGDIVEITEEKLSMDGDKFKVVSYALSGDKKEVWASVDVQAYKEP